MGRQNKESNKAGAGPVLVALRTSSGTSTLNASSSTLSSSNTGRKRERSDVSSNQESLSDSLPPLKRQATRNVDRRRTYPEYGPGFFNYWKNEEREARKAKGDEKRLRRFRTHPPQEFLSVYERAVTQRFYVLSRNRGSHAYEPMEEFEISGSTGNVYQVTIAAQPTCTCPHADKGKQCKHVIFILARVLRAQPRYVYQLALLSDELRDIFHNAPPSADDANAEAEHESQKRKPVDGDCPICFEEMDANSRSEPLVWCKAACGQNIHRTCFAMWANTKRGSTDWVKPQATCPYCRSKWEGDVAKVNLAALKRYGTRTEEGYVNVADQLGISRVQDTSTYSRWWRGHPRSYRRWRR